MPKGKLLLVFDRAFSVFLIPAFVGVLVHTAELLTLQEHVHRGTIIALAMAEALTEIDLEGIEGFPPGVGLETYAPFLDGYELTADTVVALVPIDEIINGAQ